MNYKIVIAVALTVSVAALGHENHAPAPTDDREPVNTPTHYVGEGDSYDLAIDVADGKAILLLADKKTSAPVADAKISLQGEDKSTLNFAKTNQIGVFEAPLAEHTVLQGYLIIEAADNSDAIEIQGSQTDHAPKSSELKEDHSDLGKRVFDFGAGFFVSILLAVLIANRRRLFGLLAIAILLIPSVKTTVAFAHAGHGEEPKSEAQEGSSPEISLSKKSQFLLGLRTEHIRKEASAAVLKSFGHLIPPPQGDATITAPQFGYATQFNNIVLGRKVQKDEELGFIQSVAKIPLRSSFAGEIAEIYVAQGSRVEAGAKLFRIVDRSKMWVDAEIFDNQIAEARTADKAFVITDTAPNGLEARIIGAMTPVNEDTRTAKFYVEILSLTPDLHLGGFVNVLFTLAGHGEETLIVPASAVLKKSGENIVFVKTGPESFTWKTVSIKDSSKPGFVVIKGGVEEGSPIVTVGNYQLLMKIR